MNLRGKFVPKLDWKINISGTEGADESIFERLDGAFGGIDAVVTRFNKLKATLLWGKVSLDRFCGLIVHYVDFGGVSFADKIFKVFLVRTQYVVRIEARDGCCENGIGFVVVHHKETNIAIEGHEWEGPCAVVVYHACVLVGEGAKTKKVCDRLIINIIDECWSVDVVGVVVHAGWNEVEYRGKIVAWGMRKGRLCRFRSRALQAFAWAFHVSF